jgi:hypothetical protein
VDSILFIPRGDFTIEFPAGLTEYGYRDQIGALKKGVRNFFDPDDCGIREKRSLTPIFPIFVQSE